ncbi:metallophosphoesterase [Cohnella soli]|uniref:Metallophosphoesterase n=1 Tax=Cohnella soli TaxID=425005 RepID=A0ABW0HZ10_9BACL
MLTILKGPYLQWPTLETMTFMWETSEPSTSEVRVFVAERIHSGHHGNFKRPEQLLSSVATQEYSTIHQVTVANLQPGTYYFYQVYSSNESGDVESNFYPFMTAAGDGIPFSFAVTSETGGFSGFDQSGGQINRNIFAQMKRYRPDIALFIGDIVDDGDEYDHWEKYFFAPGQELLVNTPSYCCLGNHENNGSWFYKYFAFAAPKNFYSFDYGDVHFVCLDSTDFIKSETYPYSSEEIGPGHAQYEFLLHDLRASSAKWKIVFFHYPPYVSGGYEVEAMRKLCSVMEQAGVDVVFSSHTIVYERSHPLKDGKIDFQDGIVYVVAGGAGAMPEWLLPKRAWHTSQSLAVPHFVQGVVTPQSLELRAIDENGNLFDLFRLTKDDEGNKSYF